MLYQKINFTQATIADTVMDHVNTVFLKKQKKEFRPMDGQKMTIFFDDMSMPKKELYGAMPALEFIRQLANLQGFYSLDKKERGQFK